MHKNIYTISDLALITRGSRHTWYKLMSEPHYSKHFTVQESGTEYATELTISAIQALFDNFKTGNYKLTGRKKKSK